jgi:hypothetical protein
MNRRAHPEEHHREQHQPERRNAESGFALLFIYALAATIAITLFMELPRVAFEAQRDREQLLIDRGETYSRAVQLYVRKFNRYPPDFDALDNTQNLRFLRQHYVDPMTGKDEWRLIHVGPGGIFTDSLIYNKKAADSANAPQNFITEAQQVGGNQTDPNQGVNIAGRLRPSDTPGAPGDPNNPQLAQPPLPPGVLQPGVLQPGMPQPGLIQPGLPQVDANGQIIPNTGATGPILPPGFPGQPQNPVQTLGGMPPGIQQPTTFPMTGQTGAPAGANMIGQLLTSPRPGGLNGLSGSPVPAPGNAAGAPQAAAAAPTIGGGIAGVASKREQEGIKVYRDKTKYNEWEFVYDITKDQSRTGAGVPAPQQQQGQQQQQQPGNAQPQNPAFPQQMTTPQQFPSK